MSALLFKNKTRKQKCTFSPVNTKASIQQILTVRLSSDTALIQVAEWNSPSSFKLTRATGGASGLSCQNKCTTKVTEACEDYLIVCSFFQVK